MPSQNGRLSMLVFRQEPNENEIENTPPEDGSGRKGKRGRKASDAGRGRAEAGQGNLNNLRSLANRVPFMYHMDIKAIA